MRRREPLEAARVFRAGGAGATWEVTQEVTSREKLESVNKTGDRGWGRAAYTKQEAGKRNVQEAPGWFAMRGQGRSRLSLEDKGWSDSRGTWNATLGSSDFRWAPPEASPASHPELQDLFHPQRHCRLCLWTPAQQGVTPFHPPNLSCRAPPGAREPAMSSRACAHLWAVGRAELAGVAPSSHQST